MLLNGKPDISGGPCNLSTTQPGLDNAPTLLFGATPGAALSPCRHGPADARRPLRREQTSHDRNNDNKNTSRGCYPQRGAAHLARTRGSGAPPRTFTNTSHCTFLLQYKSDSQVPKGVDSRHFHFQRCCPAANAVLGSPHWCWEGLCRLRCDLPPSMAATRTVVFSGRDAAQASGDSIPQACRGPRVSEPDDCRALGSSPSRGLGPWDTS